MGLGEQQTSGLMEEPNPTPETEPDIDMDQAGEKEALLRLLIWALNRLEELEALDAAEHVAAAITVLKSET